MIFFKKKFLFLVITLMVLMLGFEAVVANTISAVDEDMIAKEKGIFYQARMMYYNAEDRADIETAVEKLNESRGIFSQFDDGFNKYFWLGQADFILAEIAEATGNKREAVEKFTESNRLAQKALDYQPENNFKASEGYRLLADTYMRLINYNGTMYMMGKGPQALKLLKKAVSLDKENYAAYNSLATYYINAPAIGGGSVEKGIRNLQEALKSEDEFNNFISYIWLGNAYKKRGNPGKAQKNINKALEIYPNSSWARWILKEIREEN